MFRSLTFCAVLAGLAVGGCYAQAGGYVASDPYVVYTEPGVYVVANASAPVYYSDGVYWRYNGGVWMWSDVDTGNWRRGRQPPPRLVEIRDPDRYAANVRAHGRRVRVDVVAHGHAEVNGRAEGHGEMRGRAQGQGEMRGRAEGHGEMGARGRPGTREDRARGGSQGPKMVNPGKLERAGQPEHGDHSEAQGPKMVNPGQLQRKGPKMGEHGERGPIGVAKPNPHPSMPEAKGKGKSKHHERDRDDHGHGHKKHR